MKGKCLIAYPLHFFSFWDVILHPYMSILELSLLIVIISNAFYISFAYLYGEGMQNKQGEYTEKLMKRLGRDIVLAVQLFLVFLLDICKGKPFLQRIINFKKNVLSFKNKHVSKRGDSQFYKMSQLSNIWGSDLSFFC